MAVSSLRSSPHQIDRFPVLTPIPPLIGASLVRLHAQPLLSLGERSVKADVYERITSRIVAELEQGVRPWLKPWNTSMQRDALRGPYG
jgi:N-terminal domain of anti-restriction factor ArdC